MPKVALLYINDSVVGPHLQLLRQVCEPTSKSKPHVTVRFFDRLEIPEIYLTTQVSHIDFVEPGMFKPNRTGQRHRGPFPNPVFIRCKSDELTLLEHKPHFPESDFHVTIYDGPSASFAKRVLKELARFEWHLRVALQNQTALVVKDLSKARGKSLHPVADYSPDLKALFLSITSQELDKRYLEMLSERKRLSLCRMILQSLFDRSRKLERILFVERASEQYRPHHAKEKRLHDVHLTPPELAREVAEYAVSQLESRGHKIDFGDPAVGTGVFFAALLQVAGANHIASAVGVDINPDQADAARWRWTEKGMKVINDDYLHMQRTGDRSLILANPPYLRHQDIPLGYKNKLRKAASRITNIPISARSGLYVYFLIFSHEWMRSDAIAAWLIPSEFMRSSYGEAVRRYLGNDVELIRVHVYSHSTPLFENTEVAPAVVVFRKRNADPQHLVRFTSGGSLEKSDVENLVSVELLRSSAIWNVPFPIKSEGPTKHRIGDIFKIRRGIATGANDFFVMTRQRAKELGIPKIALKPLLPKARSLVTNVIESDSDGYPVLVPQLCVLDSSMPRETVMDRYPRLWDYLKSGEKTGITKRRLLRDRDIWYKQENREAPMFLCTYMGRGTKGRPPLRFVFNKSRAIATNTYILMYPKPPLAKAIAENPALADLMFEILQKAAESEMHQHTRVYAGGLHKIEPKELSNVVLDLPPELISVASHNQLQLPFDNKTS